MNIFYSATWRLSVVALSIMVSMPGNIAHAAFLDNKGTDFIITFLPNPLSTSQAVELHLTSDVSTDVTVEYPVNSDVVK